MAEQIYELRVTLCDTKPPIWRRVAVPANITLGQLHDVIQIAMGWTDSHLHIFNQRQRARKPTAHDLALATVKYDIAHLGDILFG